MAIRIVAMGDNVVDCYSELDEMFPGGNCVNVAVFASRYGANAHYIGAVGTDRAGDLLRVALAGEGVGLDLLRIIDGTTAFCVVGREDGDRVFLGGDLGVSRFHPDDADLEFLAGSDAVHVSVSSGLDAVIARVGALTKLSYDFSTLRDSDHLDRIAPHCFLASFSGGDLGPQQVDATIKTALRLGSTWVLVTQGEDGATLSDGSTTYRCDAVPTQVVDTLGAGDTFTARVLLGLLANENPDAILAAAAVAAADTCTRVGAFGYSARLAITEPSTHDEHPAQLAPHN